MAIQGLRDTSNFVANARPQNWREGILLLKPNGMLPLMGLSSLMKSRSVDDPQFNWWEKEMQTRRIALTTTITADTAGTSSVLTFSAGGCRAFKVGDLLKSEETSEVMRVNADPTADTTLSVTRGFAGTTSTALNPATSGKNPNFICIGSAYEEGSLAPTGVQFDPSVKYNYTQIFRSTLEATRTAAKTRLRTGDAIKEAKRESLEVIMNDAERALWLGVRSSSTLNGKPIRTMGGVFSQISTNVVDSGDGSYNMTDLEGWMETAFNYGASEKMAICGNRVLTSIQQVCRKNTNYQFMPGQKEFGMNVTRLICPFGELVFKSHPLWNQQTGGTNTTAYYGLNSTAVILDMEDIQYVTFMGDDIKWEKDLTPTGMDGQKGGFLGEISLQLANEKKHMVISKLNLGIADS